MWSTIIKFGLNRYVKTAKGLDNEIRSCEGCDKVYKNEVALMHHLAVSRNGTWTRKAREIHNDGPNFAVIQGSCLDIYTHEKRTEYLGGNLDDSLGCPWGMSSCSFPENSHASCVWCIRCKGMSKIQPQGTIYQNKIKRAAYQKQKTFIAQNAGKKIVTHERFTVQTECMRPGKKVSYCGYPDDKTAWCRFCTQRAKITTPATLERLEKAKLKKLQMRNAINTVNNGAAPGGNINPPPAYQNPQPLQNGGAGVANPQNGGANAFIPGGNNPGIIQANGAGVLGSL